MYLKSKFFFIFWNIWIVFITIGTRFRCFRYNLWFWLFQEQSQLSLPRKTTKSYWVMCQKIWVDLLNEFPFKVHSVSDSIMFHNLFRQKCDAKNAQSFAEYIAVLKLIKNTGAGVRSIVIPPVYIAYFKFAKEKPEFFKKKIVTNFLKLMICISEYLI